MARGNQRDKAREKNLKDKAGEVRQILSSTLRSREVGIDLYRWI